VISTNARRADRWHRAVLVAACAVSCAPPAALHAQWRLTVEPGRTASDATVTTEVREQRDSLPDVETPVALVLRCRARQLEAFLTTRDTLESDMTADVRVRLQSDSARPRDVRWQATRSGTGAFVPQRDLRDLVQRYILRSSQLTVAVSAARRGRANYVFPVADFRRSLDALRAVCVNDQGGALALPDR
jgi:hypothetical protein